MNKIRNAILDELNEIEGTILELAYSHYMYQQFLKSIEAFRSSDAGDDVRFWIWNMSQYHISICIRKLLDHDTQSHSLLILLNKIECNHKCFTRKVFLESYDEHFLHYGERDWKMIAGESDPPFIQTLEVEKEKGRLLSVTKDIRTLVDTAIAHQDRNVRTKLSSVPDDSKITTAVESILASFEKYHLLLRKTKFDYGEAINLDVIEDFTRIWKGP